MWKHLLMTMFLGMGSILMGVEWKGALTDKLPGWSFKPSRPKNGMTFNEFEGYYPDKGGKLSSESVTIGTAPEGRFFRIRFEAKAPERSYWGVDFFDREGALLPDYYGVVHAGERRPYEYVIYAMDKVESVKIFFQSTSGIEAWDLSMEPVTPAEAAEWCDRFYAGLPPLRFTAPADAGKLLPKTREALKSGKPFRVVLLGDSIMQDAFHSQFEALLGREFPAAKLNFVISMRGSTGCWFYREPENFTKYVASQKPDLLVIGGISNYNDKVDKETGTAAILEVAERARKELGCEVLLLSGALAIDTRGKDTAPREWSLEHDSAVQKQNDFPRLGEEAARRGIASWDMTTPCYTYLYRSGKEFEFFNRDRVHSGERGKQIIGRALLGYFQRMK